MRCGHCKSDGVTRDHVRACSGAPVTPAAPTAEFEPRASGGLVGQILSAAPGSITEREVEVAHELAGAIPTPADAARRAAKVVAGNGGQVQAVGGPLPAEPSSPPANPATDRQRGFLRRLANERQVTDDGSDPRTIAESLGDQVEVVIQALGKREASRLIDAWLELPLAAPAKVDDAGAPELASENGHLDRGAVHLIDGVYHRVHIGQRSGRPYVVKAVILRAAERDEAGALVRVGEVDWEIVPGLARRLRPNTLVTGAEAAAFGELVARCVFCSTPIDTPESTKAGYGPKCAADRGLPWG